MAIAGLANVAGIVYIVLVVPRLNFPICEPVYLVRHPFDDSERVKNARCVPDSVSLVWHLSRLIGHEIFGGNPRVWLKIQTTGSFTRIVAANLTL